MFEKKLVVGDRDESKGLFTTSRTTTNIVVLTIAIKSFCGSMKRYFT